ncbi:MAG: flagellar basal body rod protein FlgC [Planctomycetaceae bacterium]|nr:flagellar basal body rod protein FlgC [Planctomycetaceae bacterium]
MFTRTMDVSTSGLMAQRARMDVIAGNLANITTTRNEKNELKPYEPRFVVFQEDPNKGTNNSVGVRVAAIGRDTELPPIRKFDPQHPDADKDGYIYLPRINMMTEFTNAIEASRTYEANLGAIEISKSMANQTLRIIT